MRRLFKDSSLRLFVGTAGTNIGLAVLGLVTGALVARLLGPQGRGELTAIQTWPSVIATVAMLGLPDALVYTSAREPAQAARRLGSAMALGLLTSTVLGLVGYAAMPLLLAAQSPSVVVAARWFLLLGPLYALVGMPLHPLQGRADFARWNTLRTVPALGWLGVLLVAWGLDERRPQVVAAAYLVFLALLCVPVMALVRARLPGRFSPDPGEWIPLLRYGLPSALAGVPQVVGQRLDQLAMAAFLPTPVLGLYAVAAAWGGAAGPVVGALSAVFFPLVAAAPDAKQRSERAVASARAAVLISFPLGGLLFAATPVALPLLFGDAYRAALPAALILSAAGTVAGVKGVLANALRGLGRPAAVMNAESSSLGVFALLLLLLLRPFGITGAAVALLASNVVATALLLIRLAGLTGRRTTVFLLPSFAQFRALGGDR